MHKDKNLPLILEDADVRLSGAVRMLPAQLKLDLDQLAVRIDEADAVIQKTAHENEACRRLVAIPGIGPVTASALIAAIGNGGAFHKGREFAAWMGLVRANTPPAASRSCLVSASVVTPICENCSCKAHVQSCNNVRSSHPV